MAYVPNSGSVVAFQNNPSVLQVLATVTNPTPNQSVSGAISVSNFPATQAVSGSIAALQGTNPWVVSQNGSIATVIIGGSVAATFTPPANQSVSGAVSVSNFPTTQNVSGSVVAWLTSTNASVITVGSPVANQSVSGAVSVSNFPTTQNVSGSVVSFVTFPTNQNVSGSVVAFVSGNVTVLSSIAGGIFPISGSVAAVVTNFPTSQNVSGSVAGFQAGTWRVSVLSQVSGTASVYGVATALTSADWIASNANRRGATIYNNAGTPVFVELGTPVSSSTFSVAMQSGDYYEVPFGWTGAVSGISNSVAGVVTISELT